MIRRLSGVFLAFLLAGTALAGEKEAAAEAAARGWLVHLDAGDYAKAWSNAGVLFKRQLTSQAWEDIASGVRAPMGALRSRGARAAQRASSLPGAPDGEYVVLQFDSSFANKKVAVETVTAVFEDGVWRVVGYFIR